MAEWFAPPKSTDYQTAERIAAGWQCLECSGVRITQEPRQPHDRRQYQCEECGCRWLVQ